MTVNVGWIHEGTAFLVADSAVTFNGMVTLDRSETSFGEIHIQDPNKTVLEGTIKVAQLSKRAVAVFAGEVEPAVNSARYVRRALAAGDSVLGALRELRVNGGAQGISLLVAEANEDDGPCLWQLDEKGLQQFRDALQPIVIGSATDAHRKFIEATVVHLAGNGACLQSPGHYLTACVVAFQGQGPRQSTLPSGVGGAFFGALVTPAYAALQNDILWVVYDRLDANL